MNDALLEELLKAGTPPLLVAKVAAELARAEERAAAAATADRRSPAALKQQRYRDNLRSRTVTGGNDVTEIVTRDGLGNEAPAPSPLPLLSPQTPQITPTPLPHPEGITAYARSRIFWIVFAGIAAGCKAAKPKPLIRRRWPKLMPPPAGVSDDQWAGFVAHRTARRQPLTDRAYDLLVGKLKAEANDEWPPGRIVDEMVERGWLSFKIEWLRSATETRNGKRPHHDRPSGPIESRRRFREQHGMELDGSD